MSREVGGHKLLVGTRLVKELAEFNGELSLEGLHFWRTVFSAMTHPATTITSSSQVQQVGNLEATKELASTGDKKVIFLPCRNPPSRERVQLWLEAQKQYKSLQNVRQEKKGVRLKVEMNPETNELKSEPCQRLSNIRRQKRHNLSLLISPVRNALSPSKSTEVSAILDGGSANVEKHGEKDDDDDALAVPLESLELSSWPQPTMINENHPVSPSRFPLNKTRENISPLSVSNKDECEASPVLLNSTPILKRRRRNGEELEPLCSTPISEGKELDGVEIIFACMLSFIVSFHWTQSFFFVFCAVAGDPASQRLEQQRKSQTDPLRRVLLTTQMKVRVSINAMFLLMILALLAFQGVSTACHLCHQ